MSVYYINSYDIDDAAAFSKYGPLVVPLIHKYGGEVLASDTAGVAVEGQPRTMNAIIRFPSMETALACYNDPEYEKIKMIRINAVSNCTMVLVKEYKK